MVLTVSFELNWPESISGMLGSVEPVANISTQFISFDCFLDQRQDDGSGSNDLPLLFSRLIIIVFLPLVLLAVIVIFWYIKYCWNLRKIPKSSDSDNRYFYAVRDERKIRDSRITTTSFIILFLIHPSLVEVMFDMFN
jgi:hypothetical protein